MLMSTRVLLNQLKYLLAQKLTALFVLLQRPNQQQMKQFRKWQQELTELQAIDY